MVTTAAFREKALRHLGELPPFSPILNRLISSLAREDVSFAQLASLIERDTVLAGNVLRMVNSALYGFQGKINSVSHAIAIIGLVKLRNAALSFSVSRMWKSVRTPRAWSPGRFNGHSVACGILSDLIAQRADVEYPEGAFVAGLFHDIGKLLIAIALGDEYEGPKEDAWERKSLGISHPELGAEALERWNLPPPVRYAVLYHHAPADAPAVCRGKHRYSLADVVAAADQLANSLGISVGAHLELVTTAEAERLAVFGRLGVSEQAQDIFTAFHAEFDEIKRLV